MNRYTRSANIGYCSRQKAMQHSGLVDKVSRWVAEYFQNVSCATCIFHNYQHTKDTVAAAEEIAEGMRVSPEELETVLLACWFHDLGLFHSLENHEEKSAEIAEEFLLNQGVGEGKIGVIKACILATKTPQKPASLLEKIVCDADVSHLGMENYREKNTLLRQEFEIRRGKPFADAEWLAINRDFFREHNYSTPYARKRYNAQKDLNLNAMTNMLKENES